MPQKHWELDKEGRPTEAVVESRRRSDLTSAMPLAKSKKAKTQSELDLSAAGLGAQDVSHNVTEFVNELRREIDVWRSLPNPAQWLVSPVTQRLLTHWRHIQRDESQVIQPFFVSWRQSKLRFGWQKLLPN